MGPIQHPWLVSDRYQQTRGTDISWKKEMEKIGIKFGKDFFWTGNVYIWRDLIRVSLFVWVIYLFIFPPALSSGPEIWLVKRSSKSADI